MPILAPKQIHPNFCALVVLEKLRPLPESSMRNDSYVQRVRACHSSSPIEQISSIFLRTSACLKIQQSSLVADSHIHKVLFCLANPRPKASSSNFLRTLRAGKFSNLHSKHQRRRAVTYTKYRSALRRLVLSTSHLIFCALASGKDKFYPNFFALKYQNCRGGVCSYKEC